MTRCHLHAETCETFKALVNLCNLFLPKCAEFLEMNVNPILRKLLEAQEWSNPHTLSQLLSHTKRTH